MSRGPQASGPGEAWEHEAEVARGSLWRDPLSARALAEGKAGGWQLCGAVPVTQLGLTTAAWLFFKRRRPG